jgi:replicative DNA helicase
MSDSEIHDVEAEKALIGAVIVNADEIMQLGIRAEDFYVHRHRWIWEAILNLARSKAQIDYVTLVGELRRSGKLAEAGGESAIIALISNVPFSTNAASYAGLVQEKARRRRIVEVARGLAVAAFDEKRDVDEAVIRAIEALGNTGARRGMTREISTFIDELIADVEYRSQHPGDVFGLPTGLYDFDRLTGGLQPGELFYLGGEPGIGKSILAMQMGVAMAEKGHPGAIYSLEMRGRQVSRRMVSAKGEIETFRLKSGKMTPEDWIAFWGACEAIAKLPIMMSDEACMTTANLRADVARLRVQHRIEWFVLDYIFLLVDDMGDDATERTEKLSGRMKRICREFDLAGLTVSSVTKDKTDLRGSGQVKHDADIIGMLKEHQPDTFRGEVKQANLRTFEFTKARDLADQKGYFHLAKGDKFPVFRSYTNGYGGRL